MRLVFLDVDGVLNTDRGVNLEYPAGEAPDGVIPDPRDPTFVPLDRAPVENLQRLCQSTGADIVLTTSWRLNKNQRKCPPAINYHKEPCAPCACVPSAKTTQIARLMARTLAKNGT